MGSGNGWWRGRAAQGPRDDEGEEPREPGVPNETGRPGRRPPLVHAVAESFLAVAPAMRDIALGERILLDCDRVLGFEHPDTVAVATGLGAAHQAAGRPEKAMPLYRAALDVRLRTIGADHADTRSLAAALAEVSRPDSRPARGRVPDAIASVELRQAR